jgi:hypothetical protein
MPLWDLGVYSRSYADHEPESFTPFDDNQKAAASLPSTLVQRRATSPSANSMRSRLPANVGDIRFRQQRGGDEFVVAAWA